MSVSLNPGETKASDQDILFLSVYIAGALPKTYTSRPTSIR